MLPSSALFTADTLPLCQKRFVTLDPGVNLIKLFSRVFHRILNEVTLIAAQLCQKNFITLDPWACIIKLIKAVTYGFHNK